MKFLSIFYHSLLDVRYINFLSYSSIKTFEEIPLIDFDEGVSKNLISIEAESLDEPYFAAVAGLRIRDEGKKDLTKIEKKVAECRKIVDDLLLFCQGEESGQHFHEVKMSDIFNSLQDQFIPLRDDNYNLQDDNYNLQDDNDNLQ